jgi:hypothetical protein
MSDNELKLSQELSNIANVNYTYGLSLHKKFSLQCDWKLLERSIQRCIKLCRN